jgi:hypothetical protein
VLNDKAEVIGVVPIHDPRSDDRHCKLSAWPALDLQVWFPRLIRTSMGRATETAKKKLPCAPSSRSYSEFSTISPSISVILGHMAETVEFPSNGRVASGYFVTPPVGSGPGVLVIQEWWGLDSGIKEMADRLGSNSRMVGKSEVFGSKRPSAICCNPCAGGCACNHQPG